MKQNNSSPIKPYGEYIVVTPSLDEMTKSGIYNVGGEKDRTEAVAVRGHISALPDKYKGSLKVGDTVFVAKWEVQKVKFNTKEYALVKEKDILGVLI